MTVQEIANRLVELCNNGDYQTCYDELYAPDARSIEPEGVPFEREVKGMEAFKIKGEKWKETLIEVHGGKVGDPIVAGNHFCCTSSLDATFKEGGRMNFEELCVYEVKDGKIVKEQFFYSMG